MEPERKRVRARRAAVWVLLLLLILPLTACADGKGSATAYDGFVVRTERTRELTADAPTRSAERSMPDSGGEAEDYVLNKSSGKFHYPWCASVGEIKASNRWDYHGTRETVIELGYQPCKICSP
jgi:hypothetical protein